MLQHLPQEVLAFERSVLSVASSAFDIFKRHLTAFVGDDLVGARGPGVDDVGGGFSLLEVEVPSSVGGTGIHAGDDRARGGSFDLDESAKGDGVSTGERATITQGEGGVAHEGGVAKGSLDAGEFRGPFLWFAIDGASQRSIFLIEG